MKKVTYTDNKRGIDSCTGYLVVYTDGSCLSNPGGAGGWAFLIRGLPPLNRKNIDKDSVNCLQHQDLLISGGTTDTTNNRMELTAVIEALDFIRKMYGSTPNGNSSVKVRVSLHTDSQLTLNCATGVWKRKTNVDLWKDYDRVSQGLIIDWTWVKAHSTDQYNNMVDVAARNEACLYRDGAC